MFMAVIVLGWDRVLSVTCRIVSDTIENSPTFTVITHCNILCEKITELFLFILATLLDYHQSIGFTEQIAFKLLFM